MAESTNRSGTKKVLIGLLWTLTALEALTMGLSGLVKFFGPTWVTMFEGWGYARWFTYVVGVAEVGGAVAILLPRIASYAALMLLVIMLGAIWTELTRGPQLGPLMPTIHIVVLSTILIARWRGRWLPRS